MTKFSIGGALTAYWKAYASIEAKYPAAWAPYVHYEHPRPLVSSLVPIADRRRLARLAGAVEAAAVSDGDSETAAVWAERRDEWERA